MKAMILAAGRGERMRPLTDSCPKPMLKVAGIPLIEHHIIKLAKAGVTDIVINHAWLGEQIEEYIKDGSQWNVSINYSRESKEALETAGGIIKALPLLRDETNPEAPFLVVNGDVYTDFDFTELPKLSQDCLAHIWLVNNPEHNLTGDFLLSKSNKVRNIKDKSILSNDYVAYTFSGIGLYKPALFSTQKSEHILPLGPLLRDSAEKLKLSGKLLLDHWTDVGTPERLDELNRRVTIK